MTKKTLEESTKDRWKQLAGINEGYRYSSRYNRGGWHLSPQEDPEHPGHHAGRRRERPKEEAYVTAKNKLAFMNKKGRTEVAEFAKQHAKSVGIPLDDVLFEAMFSLSVAYENAVSSIQYMQDLARLKGKSLEELGITDEYMKNSIEEAYNMAKAEFDAGKERDEVRQNIIRSFSAKIDDKVKQAL